MDLQDLQTDPRAAVPRCEDQGEFEAGNAAAKQNNERRKLRLEDFWCYLEGESAFIFIPTGKIWPGTSVDKCVPPVDIGAEKPVRASTWISTYRHVEQMTWAPGLPQFAFDLFLKLRFAHAIDPEEEEHVGSDPRARASPPVQSASPSPASSQSSFSGMPSMSMRW